MQPPPSSSSKTFCPIAPKERPHPRPPSHLRPHSHQWALFLWICLFGTFHRSGLQRGQLHLRCPWRPLGGSRDRPWGGCSVSLPAGGSGLGGLSGGSDGVPHPGLGLGRDPGAVPRTVLGILEGRGPGKDAPAPRGPALQGLVMGLGFGEQGGASTAAPGGPGEDVQGWLLRDQAPSSGHRVWGLVPHPAVGLPGVS